ncbi:hypothetical protein UA08_02949 [Talaromyces atroroseus]|uniref:Uncharacterized protein n=1 Tax=Talaromyces atroroseus TaxID=1441469 RepID=A0A225ALX5_TALAT|nr:hypothetical protein UA08_02949 [Talaromyces atroroseus]OKL62552.1 hypothetical protein UA08_02949 [Talaromyces atroroseus]
MAPDLNSLPPSRSSTSSPLQPRTNSTWSTAAIEAHHSNGNNPQAPSPRSSSAAPTMNNISTDLSHRSSLSSSLRSSSHSNRPSVSEGRRRSGIGMHLNLNDPNPLGADNHHHEHRSPSFSNFFRTASPTSLGGSPIIGIGDPHHQRAPSLGELHQELEQEQEAQVNRLLQMIRQQQVQLQQLQQQQQNQPSNSGTAIVDDITPSSERSQSFPTVPPLPTPGSRSMQQVQSSFSTRRGSRASETMSPRLSAVPHSAQSSPAIDPVHSSVGSEWSILGGGNEAAIPSSSARRSSRDESVFYQAEAAMLTRENQMLQMRIRELERQLNELSSAANNNDHGSGGGASTGETVAAVSEAEGPEKT